MNPIKYIKDLFWTVHWIFTGQDIDDYNDRVAWMKNNTLMNIQYPIPVVGEHWDRSDGSTDGITIIDVHGGDLAWDIWIKYKYDSGQESEKNWTGFHSRFHKKDKL